MWKKLFLGYQRAMWLANRAYDELNKPLAPYHISLPLITFLAVIGFKVGIIWFAGINLIGLGLMVIGGKILEHYGVIAYNTKMTNKQSPELIEILEIVRELKSKK